MLLLQVADSIGCKCSKIKPSFWRPACNYRPVANQAQVAFVEVFCIVRACFLIVISLLLKLETAG